MNQEDKELANAVSLSIRELHRCLDSHCCLVAAAMEQGVDLRNVRLPAPACTARSREAEYKKAIREAIDALEESRKAFKSRKLEVLRRRLMQVLMDEG